VRSEDLERVTGRSVLGKNVPIRARIDFASTLFASNIPNARNGVAVLALTESGTTTAVVEVDKGINTFVVTTNQARNRAGRETFRASGHVARTVLSLLSSEAFVPATVVVVVTPVVVVVVIVVTGRLSGFARWFRWIGRVGRS